MRPMARTRTAIALGGFAAMLLGTPVTAQDAELPLPDSVQELIAEFQMLQQRLGEIQERTLERSQELRQEQERVGEAVREAMVRIDPDVRETMTRLDVLHSEVETARTDADHARLQELLDEAQRLQLHYRQIQAAALEQPEIGARVESFQSDLIDGMKETDPETERLIERLEKLAARLQATQPPS